MSWRIRGTAGRMRSHQLAARLAQLRVRPEAQEGFAAFFAKRKASLAPGLSLSGAGVLAQSMPKSLGHPGRRRPWPVNMGVPTNKSDNRGKIPSSSVRLVDASPMRMVCDLLAADFSSGCGSFR